MNCEYSKLMKTEESKRRIQSQCQLAFRIAKRACEHGIVNGHFTAYAMGMIARAQSILSSVGVPDEELAVVFPG